MRTNPRAMFCTEVWSNNTDGPSQISGIPEFYADDFSKIAKDELAQNRDFRIEPLTAYAGVLWQVLKFRAGVN